MQGTQLRPLRVAEILDVAVKIYLRNAGTLFRLVLVVVAPVQALSVLILASAIPEPLLGLTTTQPGPPLAPEPAPPVQAFDASDLWAAAAGGLLLLLLAVIGGILSTAACFKAVAGAYLGERPEWRESLRFAAGRIGGVLWVTILSGIVAFLPLLGAALVAALLIGAGGEGGGVVAVIALVVVVALVASVWLYVSLQVAVPALLTEDVRGRRALGRSHGLVKGRWWPAFGLLLLGGILASVVSTMIRALLTGVTLTDLGDGSLAQLILGAIGTTIATVLTTPFTAAFITVLYFDLRVRKEGFDLELLAARMGLPPPSNPAASPLPPIPARHEEGSSGQPPFWPPPPGWPPPGDEPRHG